MAQLTIWWSSAAHSTARMGFDALNSYECNCEGYEAERSDSCLNILAGVTDVPHLTRGTGAVTDSKEIEIVMEGHKLAFLRSAKS
jgi:hypothetical protein